MLKVLSKTLIKSQSTNSLLEEQVVPDLVKKLYENNLNWIQERFNVSVRDIDFQNVTEIYWGSQIGLLLAVALKNAGTGDSKSIAAILALIYKIRTLKVLFHLKSLQSFKSKV